MGGMSISDMPSWLHTSPMPLTRCCEERVAERVRQFCGTITPIAFVRRVFRLRAIGLGV